VLLSIERDAQLSVNTVRFVCDIDTYCNNPAQCGKVTHPGKPMANQTTGR
jgi:hypothetical protein